MNVQITQSPTVHPLPVHTHSKVTRVRQSRFSFPRERFWAFLNPSNQDGPALSSCGVSQHARQSRFFPLLHLHLPVSPPPSHSWLSHLFENVLQAFLERGRVGRESFENLLWKMSSFYSSHLIDTSGEERKLPGRERFLRQTEWGAGCQLRSSAGWGTE